MYIENEKISDVTLYMRKRNDAVEGNPFEWDIKRASDLFAGKRVVIFGLPGAFTPTCSNSQLPGYEALYEEFISNGIDEVWCTSVNDAFVMFQWACAQGIENVKMLPDGNGEFASSLGMLVEKTNLGFGMRSWRYSLVLNNMRVEKLFAEDEIMSNCPDDPYVKSNPETILNYVKKG